MNILRFKHVLRDSWGSDSGGDVGGNDATAYGGKESGFDPNTPGVAEQFKGNMGSGGVMENTTSYIPGTESFAAGPAVAPNQFSYLTQLSDMFNNKNPQFAATSSQLPGINQNLGQLTQSSPDLGTTQENQFDKNGLAYRLGLRMPGTEAAKNFFGTETPAERDTRISMIGEGIGNVGQAMMHTMMPAPIRMGMGLASAYKNWDSDKPMASAGRALGALPGYAGIAGQAMQGNYGSALAGGLTKSGMSPMSAGGLGMGLDAFQGKDVTRPATGLAGYAVGNQLGGPVGGVFGQNLAKMFTRKK